MTAPADMPEIAATSASAESGAELLLRSGALVVRGAASASALATIDGELGPNFEGTPFSRGPFYGDRTVRFGRVLARSRGMRALAIDPLVHGIAGRILEPHRGHSISFAQAIAVHPGSRVQAPHRDGEMWPVPPGGPEHLVSVMWPLTRFDASTGATRVWPRRADGTVADKPRQPALRPGDALLFLGSTTHGAGANLSAEIRRGVVVGYAAAWLVPAENPVLAYPPAVARTMPVSLTSLLGYRRLAPNLNNYDCRCPSELLRGAQDRPDLASRGAIDELHPEQVEGLERFHRAMADAS